MDGNGRIEAFVKIPKKKIFFGGWGGASGWRASVSGWM